LIWLAEKTGVLQIETIDQGDFSVYWVRGRRRFRILIGSKAIGSCRLAATNDEGEKSGVMPLPA
jgi:hypothetical protein